MFKVFESLKNPKASKKQVLNYKKELDERNRRIHELKKTDSILTKLKASYDQHKHDLPTKRYDALKEMIEDAIKELRNCSDVGQQPYTARGKIGNLLKSTAEFASNTPSDVFDEDISSTEINNKLKDLTREIEKLKTDYRQRRDILEDMDKKYKDALLLDPIKRYAQVKTAAKSSIAAYNKII